MEAVAESLGQLSLAGPARRGRTVVGFNADDARHVCAEGHHVECPERTQRALEELRAAFASTPSVSFRSDFGLPDEATAALAADEAWLEGLAATETMDREERSAKAAQYDSVYLAQGSSEAALGSLSVCVGLVRDVCEGRARNAFALVRPPGHHASRAAPNGFCLLNNVVATARAVLEEGLAKRVLIVDLDVHHGQGTQDAFYSSDAVLYASIHRYEESRYWPHLRRSAADHVGEGEGRGFNLNLPLEETGCGDGDYSALLYWGILPMALEFQPDLVLVSAGFDAAAGDPKGLMRLSPQWFGHAVRLLETLAQGRMLLVLEVGFVSAGFDAAAGDPKGLMRLSPQWLGHAVRLLETLAQGRMLLVLEVGFVSAGFDAAAGDPKGLMRLSPQWFGHAVRLLETLAQGRMLLVLEVGFVSAGFDAAAGDPKGLMRLSPQWFGHAVRLLETLAQGRMLLVLEVGFVSAGFDAAAGDPKGLMRLSPQWFGHAVRLLETLAQGRMLLVLEVGFVSAGFDAAAGDPKGLMRLSPQWFGHAVRLLETLAQGRMLLVLEVGFVSAGFDAAAGDPKGLMRLSPQWFGHAVRLLETLAQGRMLLVLEVGFVSAGFDAAAGDPKGLMRLSPQWFGHAVRLLETLAQGRMLLVLEVGFVSAGFDAAAGDPKGLMRLSPQWFGHAVRLLETLAQVRMLLVLEVGFVSAGFDAAAGDPKGLMRLSPQWFGHAVRLLETLAQGRMLLVLEGGYDPASVAAASVECVAALAGFPPPLLPPTQPPKARACRPLNPITAMGVALLTTLFPCSPVLVRPTDFVDLQGPNDTTSIFGRLRSQPRQACMFCILNRRRARIANYVYPFGQEQFAVLFGTHILRKEKRIRIIKLLPALAIIGICLTSRHFFKRLWLAHIILSVWLVISRNWLRCEIVRVFNMEDNLGGLSEDNLQEAAFTGKIRIQAGSKGYREILDRKAGWKEVEAGVIAYSAMSSAAETMSETNVAIVADDMSLGALQQTHCHLTMLLLPSFGISQTTAYISMPKRELPRFTSDRRALAREAIRRVNSGYRTLLNCGDGKKAEHLRLGQISLIFSLAAVLPFAVICLCAEALGMSRLSNESFA